MFVPSVMLGLPHRSSAVAGGVLPLAAVPAPRPNDNAVYGMAAVDGCGRITDQVVLRALGWGPGTRIDVDVSGGVAVVAARSGGTGRVIAAGRFRLPAAVRHQLRIGPGDRVLLAARPPASRLVICPSVSLDALLPSAEPFVGGGQA